MRGDPAWIAERLGLKRSGSEYKGPCPVCGGVDRFHVRAGRSADLLIHCRHGCKYSEIAAELERTGIVEREEYTKPTHRRDDLELCDHMIAVMRGAVQRGEKIQSSDALKIGRLITLVDNDRAGELKKLREQMGSGNGNDGPGEAAARQDGGALK
jgi:hypothetical protein